jgi:putative membrane protein
MAFIDDLAMELFTLALVGIVSVYMTASVYLEYRKNGAKNIEEILKPGVFPLGVLGVVILIMGFYGEMTWPLPGSYNILFYDPYMFIGMILVMMAVAIGYRQKLQYVGILAFFAGIIAIYYGANAYIDKMTSSPIAMLGLYIAFGLTGVFTFPTTLIYDMLPGREKVSKGWTVILVLFWLGLIISAVLAAITAIEAVPQHLLSPP